MRFPSSPVVLLFSFLCLFLLSTTTIAQSQAPCFEKEKQALLDFKLSFEIVSPYYQYPPFSSWSNATDACSSYWDGVGCDNHTGHVTSLDFSTFGSSLKSYKLRPSLLELQHLIYLDLSLIYLDTTIPNLIIGSLGNLIELRLSYTGLFGEIPPHIGNLSKLQYLDLSGSFGLYAHNLRWLSRLPSLETLDLSEVNLSKALDWASSLRMLPTLSDFQCDGCSLPTPPLSSIHHINSSTSLRELALSSNSVASVFSYLVNGTDNLDSLRLDYMIFDHDNRHDQLFHSINSRPRYSLHTLSINGNNLNTLALKGTSLPSLTHLYVSSNNLSTLALKGLMLPSLTSLYASFNRISGSLPTILQYLPPNLTDLDLSSNLLSGSILAEHPSEFSKLIPSLTSLDASFNRINGSLSTILQYLSPNLTSLDLSSNLFSETVLEEHLSKFLGLTYLSLSDNKLLTFIFSEGWVPPFQLLYALDLRSCKVGPSFPSWILTQKNLVYLDISNSMISDILLPTAFSDLYNPNTDGVQLNLSHNNISGMAPNLNFPFTYSGTLDLSYNNFHGPIPSSLFKASILYLSNNKFSSLPQEPLSYSPVRINLSNNNLSGELPDWIFQSDLLSKLNLQNNRFSGTLPETIGSALQLSTLHLSNNNFSGQLPLSMKNCTQLKILELANNKFDGVVPSWIGESMTQLVALTLRSNDFYGDLPSSLCHLQGLQILDLSDNKFSGAIPTCVHNFSAMATSSSLSSVYDFNNVLMLEKIDFSSFIWKGKREELQNTNLEHRNVIDLSGNLFSGEIPIGVTALTELISLDLSGNNLNGSIPDKIGQMTSLEVLLLSSNRLSGEIPQSLTSLTFLGTLNLSYNNLSGRIPDSTQLESLADSLPYNGNPMLCGKPLFSNCPGDGLAQTPPSKDAEDDGAFDIQAFLAAVGMGFAFGLLGVLGIFHFNRQCRLAFFRLADNIGDRIFVATSLLKSRIKGKLRLRKENN